MTPRWPEELLLVTAKINGHDVDNAGRATCASGEKCVMHCNACGAICPECEPGEICRIRWERCKG